MERALARVGSPVVLTLLGHAAIACAILVNDGVIDAAHEPGVATAQVVLVVVALAVWASALHAASTRTPSGYEDAARVALFVALGSASVAFVRSPGSNVRGDLAPYHALSAGGLLLLATYAADLLGIARVPRAFVLARRGALFAIAIALSAWMLRASPDPRIDVFSMHQQSAQALLAGRSIYEPGVINVLDTHQYARVFTTYAYLPLTAYLTAVAFFFTHDVRWADAVAQLSGGVLLWLVAERWASGGAEPRSDADTGDPSPALAPGIWADLLAALLLFHPRGLLVLEKAWVEPLALPFLGGFVLSSIAGRRVVAGACLGLLCVAKQTLPLYLPFLVLAPAVGPIGASIAAGVALATLVPFLIRSPLDLYRGAFASVVATPFRDDAVAIPALVSHVGVRLPAWLGFVAALVPLAWVRRAPRGVGPLLLGSCLVFGLFYVLGRQAFGNYYYLLDATSLFAAATLTRRRVSPDRS